VLSLVAHPAPNAEVEHSILYIGATRGAYLSPDGGDTIESWGQGLEGVSVTAILFDPNDSRNIYAGTAYAGLYRSVDQGETWQPIGPPKLSEEIVEMMTLSSEGELFVASSGGLWVGRRE
jgi:ligand-binding sensor domain-containing protein